MAKKTKIILIIALIFIVILTIFVAILNKPIKTVNPDDVYNCTRDADCVSFQSDCCNCRNGGANIALNRKYLDYWVKELSLKCQETLCTAVISDDWTCLSEPKCVDNKCQLVK